jgi:hypothetical protein
VKECVQRFFKKICLRKKIAAMPFQAAEVRASMPPVEKKVVAQRSVQKLCVALAEFR